MPVLIDNRQNRRKIDLKILQQTVGDILNVLDLAEAELSLVIVDDDQITELNATYLSRQGPTNVIAFAMREGPFGELNPDLLGDVIVSVETAEKEAAAAEMDAQVRFIQLVVHGVLHLLGYDHETDAREAQGMEAQSETILKNIGSYDGLLP